MEYEHIEDINKFINNIRRYGDSQLEEMPDLWQNINDDPDYSNEDKQRLLDAVSTKWTDLQKDRDERLAKEEAERVARAERERIEERNRIRSEAGRRRQEENRQRRANRDISEYEDSELVSQYQRLDQDINRMVEASHGRSITKENIARYNAMKDRRANLKSEIDKRRLTIENESNEIKLSNKERDKIEADYFRTKNVKGMSLDRIVEEERDLNAMVSRLENQLGRSASLKQDEINQISQKLAETKIKLGAIKKQRLKKQPIEDLLNESQELKSKIAETKEKISRSDVTPMMKERYQNELKELEKQNSEYNKVLNSRDGDIKALEESRKREAERIAREKAEQERLARERAEQERLARERAEQERLARERAEQERLAREALYESIQKAEQERIAREKAEQERIAREKAEQERIAREKAEQERLARERAEQERKNIIKKIGAGIVAGLTAISVGIGTWWNRMFKEKNTKLLPMSNRVYDIDEENQNNNNKYNVQDYTIQDNQHNNEKDENPMDKYKLSEEDLQQSKKQNEKDIEAQAMKQFELGQAIKLPQGMEFSEGVSGGKKGTIGDSNSPREGVYIINRFAEVGKDNISNQYGLEGKIEKNMKDSDVYVHIAYVPGAQKEADAKELIEKKGQKEQDRGWVKLSELKKAYDQRQQEENQKQVEK